MKFLPAIWAGVTGAGLVLASAGENPGIGSLIERERQQADAKPVQVGEKKPGPDGKGDAETLQGRIKALEESLALSETEAEYFREKWTELRLRNEAIGLEALTADEKALQEKVVRLVGELYRSEKRRLQLEAEVKKLEEAAEALLQAGPLERAEKRAEYEVARRRLDAATGEAEMLPIARDLNSGVVVSVNDDLGVVVLNFGRAQNARPGMPFRILRGGKPIGRCEVFEIREYKCAALVSDMIKNEKVQAGDRVLLETLK
jgi:hypothetical protein